MAPVARTPFLTDDATIVVSTDGYFDVFAPVARTPNDKPSYRGIIAELGPTVRLGDRLSVRPDSVALREAVTAWSEDRGAAAVRGDLGGGRDHEPDRAELEAAAEAR
jgi:ribonuclease HI